MKKFCILFALFAMYVLAGCEENGVDNINPNNKPNTEKPDDQVPDNAYISLNMERVSFAPEGDSIDIKVYCNYAWELTNNCDWCTTSITNGEASDTGVTVTLTADLSYDDREGTIVFSCGKAKKPLVVSQNLKEVIIANEDNTFSVPGEGGTIEISYKTSVECEVIIPNEARGWIALTPATRGLASKNAVLYIANNNTGAARECVVKVAKVGDNSICAEYTIKQEQNDVIIAENNTINITGIEQTVDIVYKTNIECNIVIPVEAKEWISAISTSRALINKSATLNISQNNTGVDRSAIVKVVAVGNNELVEEFFINQKFTYFIEYTTTDDKAINLKYTDMFDAKVLQNHYTNGKGYIEFESPITSIGDYAFDDCSSLASITIPESVTSIGRRAFSGCSSLASITIPEGVTTIGDYAFYECSSLTSITIPEGVTSIGWYAFFGCSSLASVTIGNGVSWIGPAAFDSCIGELTINSNHVCGSQWFGDFKFTTLNIGGDVTSIKGAAFNDCSSLTSVAIGNSVTSIEGNAFYNCSSLTSVTIGNSVTSIGEWAFSNCASLTSINIPNSVTTIGNHVFDNCDNLPVEDYIMYADTYAVKVIDNSLYSYELKSNTRFIGEGAFEGCINITNIIIPNSVILIKSGAFMWCDNLENVTIGSGVLEIQDFAFQGCNSLRELTIPDSVRNVGEGICVDCSHLNKIVIGSNVECIVLPLWGSSFAYAIAGWPGLHIYSKATNPPRLIEVANPYAPDLTDGEEIACFYVPTGCADIYKSNEDWGGYGIDFIEVVF